MITDEGTNIVLLAGTHKSLAPGAWGVITPWAADIEADGPVARFETTGVIFSHDYFNDLTEVGEALTTGTLGLIWAAEGQTQNGAFDVPVGAPPTDGMYGAWVQDLEDSTVAGYVVLALPVITIRSDAGAIIGYAAQITAAGEASVRPDQSPLRFGGLYLRFGVPVPGSYLKEGIVGSEPAVRRVWAKRLRSRSESLIQLTGIDVDVASTQDWRVRYDPLFDRARQLTIDDDEPGLWRVNQREVSDDGRYMILSATREVRLMAGIRLSVQVAGQLPDPSRARDFAARVAFRMHERLVQRYLLNSVSHFPVRTGRMRRSFGLKYDRASASISIFFGAGAQYGWVVNRGQPVRGARDKLAAAVRRELPAVLQEVLDEVFGG